MLKSYIGTLIACSLSLAFHCSDTSRWSCSGPVIVYADEGGRVPYLRRVNRMCKALGLDLKEVLRDYYNTTPAAPIGQIMRFSRP